MTYEELNITVEDEIAALDIEAETKERILRKLDYRLDKRLYECPAYFNTEQLEAVEKALGFKLFRWQKSYIEVGKFRNYGRTTAEILRELLQPGPPIDYRRRPTKKLDQIYMDNLLDIKMKLDITGIETRDVLLSNAMKRAMDEIYKSNTRTD